MLAILHGYRNHGPNESVCHGDSCFLNPRKSFAILVPIELVFLFRHQRGNLILAGTGALFVCNAAGQRHRLESGPRHSAPCFLTLPLVALEFLFGVKADFDIEEEHFNLDDNGGFSEAIAFPAAVSYVTNAVVDAQAKRNQTEHIHMPSYIDESGQACPLSPLKLNINPAHDPAIAGGDADGNIAGEAEFKPKIDFIHAIEPNRHGEPSRAAKNSDGKRERVIALGKTETEARRVSIEGQHD